MPLSPEQSLNLAVFTDFQPLVNVYLDQFVFLVLFRPANPLVSDFTPTAEQQTFIQEMWNGQHPQINTQLGKAVRLEATIALDTSSQAIQLLRAGAAGTVTAVFNIFKSEIPNLVVLNTPTP